MRRILFNSRLVNEARLGFNRIAIQFIPNFSTSSSTLGFNNYPAGVTPADGIPQMTRSPVTRFEHRWSYGVLTGPV